MPRSTVSAWTCGDGSCPICTAPERDDMTVLRCAILTLLEHGRWMVGDDIPLPDILSAGGRYLSRFKDAVADGAPKPAPEHWAWLEAELRLVVARAAGLDAVSTLDPRIDDVLAEAAGLPEYPLVDLLDLAAEQFTELCRRPRTA
ncbi:hypothetical protein OG413_09610 [Streptomyces sp. NBC_01433]|uniref:hypothetical protein n=1 Tax=Streptomyces sp. NBC_01433 TaxID=2903864 RepID=UPI00225B423C|nr:hypothetical protein [Streptomyces sp. NBC_01433]MCX4675562.1 hypothetical protein [Streptomyces sp. NBC_01433]